MHHLSERGKKYYQFCNDNTKCSPQMLLSNKLMVVYLSWAQCAFPCMWVCCVAESRMCFVCFSPSQRSWMCWFRSRWIKVEAPPICVLSDRSQTSCPLTDPPAALPVSPVQCVTHHYKPFTQKLVLLVFQRCVYIVFHLNTVRLPLLSDYFHLWNHACCCQI